MLRTLETEALLHENPACIEGWCTCLEKGDVISADIIEALTGMSPDERLYGVQRMRLQERIYKARAKLGAVPILTCAQGDDLVVLRDDEASDYGWGQTMLGVRKLCRWANRLSLVDESNLSPEMQETHGRRVSVAHFMKKGALSAKRKALRLSAAPDVPRLPGV